MDQTTPPTDWRMQSPTNRQGSVGLLLVETGAQLSQKEAAFHRAARELYEERLAFGVAREQARKDLPLSTYTEAYWKIDLHNLFHFLSLRMDEHAQAEIRAYAEVIGTNIVRALAQGDSERAMALARGAALLPPADESPKRNRERDELESKLIVLGLPIPWVNSE